MAKDSILSAMSGACTSFVLMITQSIKVDEVFQVFIYGLIGGASGILGKLLFKKLVLVYDRINLSKIITFFKNIKSVRK